VSVREKNPDPVAAASILITDGEARAALAAARSLGRAGYAVHVVSSTGQSIAGASRWCRSEHRAEDPDDAPEAWATRIESLACQLHAHVLPTTEVAIGSLFAAGGEKRLNLIAPSRTDYETAIDKYGLVTASQRIGIDVPQSLLVERFDALEELPEPLHFPVVAKPRRSRILYEGRWHSPPVRVIRNAEAFRHAVAEWLPAHGDTLLQEFVPGVGEGLFALCDQGQIHAQFAHRRLREKPPLGGVSVLRESIEASPDIERASKQLLADLGFSGIAMVEFRRAPSGRLVLMEINPRPWGSMQLAIDSGVDFPRLMVEASIGANANAESPVAHVGVRTRWLLGDLDNWILSVRSPMLRKELGLSLAGVTLAFLRSFFDGTRLEVLRIRDSRPFLRELALWFRRLR